MLGLTSGGVPLVSAQIRGPQVDAFDNGGSYVVWMGGVFLAALGLAYMQPERRWLWGPAVLSGFFAAVVLEIIIDSYTGRFPNILWPLTLAITLVIGAPPAFVGAYLGGKLRLRVDWSRPK